MPFTIADLPFLLVMPVLLAFSAFFSGSETALFGLDAHHRAQLLRGQGMVGRSLRALLANQRTLLVTLMFSNIIVNVLYFVVGSTLVLRLDAVGASMWWMLVMSAATLTCMILFGEITPKLIANTMRLGWVRATSIPLYAIHRLISPFGSIVARWIVRPLGRLLVQPTDAGELDADELQAMLEMSQNRGVIDADEQQLLRQVIQLSQLKVADIMVPRVDVVAVDVNDPPQQLRDVIGQTGLTKFIAIEGDLDHVVGLIYARQFLLAAGRDSNVNLRSLTRGVRFIPELQRVDQLLGDFRKTGTKLAVVVDEYGGTAGLVTLKDVVERMVGDLDMDAGIGETPESETQQVSPGVWRLSGRLSVHDWPQAFGHQYLPKRVSTVGGLVMALLGHVPTVGEQTRLANLTLEVERMDGGRVESVLLKMHRFDDEQKPLWQLVNDDK